MAKRYHMSQDSLIRRILRSYADCIVKEDGGIDFEESCYRISCRLVEDLPPTQQESAIGASFENAQECYDYITRHIPGLAEAMYEFMGNE